MEEIEILANGFFLKTFPTPQCEAILKNICQSDLRKLITIMLAEFAKQQKQL